MRILKKIFRFIPLFNKIENEFLHIEFEDRIVKLKEENSKAKFYDYYVPIAQNYYLNKEGLLYSKNDKCIHNRAIQLFFDDLHNKKLDEFYNFI